MKKIMMVLLSAFMIMGLVGCGNSERRTGQPSTEDNLSESSVSDEALGESSDTDDAESRKVSEIQSEGAAETLEVQTKEAGTPEIQTEEGEIFESNKTRVLVAYFSATNTTEGVAEHIANGLNADLYEIVPAEPYTDADLDYNDNHSRTTIEMDDADARPAISGSVEDMEQCLSGIRSGGEKRRGSSALLWKAMTSTIRRLSRSVHPAAAAWVPVPPIWSSLQTAPSGLTDNV